MKKLSRDLLVILRVVIGVAVFSAMVFYSFEYLNNNFRTKDADYNDPFRAIPENSMDVIVLGSSHAQYSFLPTLFNQHTGLYSYVLGSACQPFEVSYEMLKEAYKTQSPELVIMEVYTSTPLSLNCLTDGCYVMASYQMTGEERYNTLDYLDEEKALSYRNEFINNHNNWKDYDNFKELIKGNAADSDIDTVFGYRWNICELPAWNYWYPMVTDEKVEVNLDLIDIEMLNNIKNLCDKNDTQFMLYMVPMDSIDVVNQAYRDKVWEWAKENDVLYKDYVRSAPEDGYHMIIHNDGAHSYVNGASITTKLLADFVNDNFVFKNHKENELLNIKLKAGNGSTMTSALLTEYNPLKYVEYLKGYKGLVLLRYNNKGQMPNAKLLQDLKDLGIDNNFNEYALYFAIIDNGELVYSSYDEGQVEYEGIVYEFHDWGILRNYDVVNNSSDLSIVVYNNEKTNYVEKNIDYLKSVPWEYGYSWYGE